MIVRALLCFAVLFLVAGQEEGQEQEQDKPGGVIFWETFVTMTCPRDGKWFKDKKEVSEGPAYAFEYDNKKGRYHCTYDNSRYDFYVQGKVCENCFELDGGFWGMIIAADMFLTVVVMVMVYKCAKKRSSAALPRVPKAGGRAPPLPSPDYEPLNPHTRSQGTYSEVHPKRMG
ncbi:T-cell surface glycoprotein CD3 epsilon chain precursor [Takifugu rubripes]|uniref:CD3 epsilon n=1 Tax=Takifugu rubripes TaxID=31033 RepID=Q589Z2_TAKRU|nr:T-cell surface glycoprotein CD3 epsilon chain precursor [Takifugu rubripes]BAD93375.1 CD3 epsilon [Takifugu rubripes]|eukprot:NP_001033071.1 T-cell surface glycoprotein CD3 epsilon chain precursor [Takifugu rubripes]